MNPKKQVIRFMEESNLNIAFVVTAIRTQAEYITKNKQSFLERNKKGLLNPELYLVAAEQALRKITG